MFVGALALWWRVSLVFVAGIAAGVVNGIAGGGTFITFPTLLALGVPALKANLSTTVGVVPSYLGSLRVFRTHLAAHRGSHRLAGALVRARCGRWRDAAARRFGRHVSTRRALARGRGHAALCRLAVHLAPSRARRHEITRRVSSRWSLGVFFVSIYGGYFGAGLGILLLAVMAVALPLDIKEIQGLRNAISLMINVTAALIFVVHGHLATSDVIAAAAWEH